MGMPLTIEIPDPRAGKRHVDEVLAYLTSVDERFSTYKATSEISRINDGSLRPDLASDAMREVFALSEETRRMTGEFFDIRRPSGGLDPSGIVKGLAIQRAADILRGHGFENFYVDLAGDIQAEGMSGDGVPWAIGIRNPFVESEIVKVLRVSGRGVATSGTYVRGQHIYDPSPGSGPLTDVVSLTVIGPNVYEADRFATAAFAMGANGIQFVESLPGFEGYAIDRDGIATMTSGFETYALPYAQAH